MQTASTREDEGRYGNGTAGTSRMWDGCGVTEKGMVGASRKPEESGGFGREDARSEGVRSRNLFLLGLWHVPDVGGERVLWLRCRR